MPKVRDINTLFEENSYPEPNTGCWLWFKYTNKKGYGALNYKKSYKIAHRLSYEYHIGKIPKNMLVCHKCDTPSCVNPDHLFLGFPKDNSLDCVKKNRQSNGSNHPGAKLNESFVREIRYLLSTGTSAKEIQKIFNMSSSPIFKIKHGKTWKWVK